MNPVTKPQSARVCGEATHLNENVRAMLAWTDEDRIRQVKSSRWIGYTQALEVLDCLEDLLDHPPTYRMPNLLLFGETNNGKTAIVERFKELHPARDNPDGNGIVVPVLVIPAPDEASEHRFYNAILDKLYAPYKAKDKIDKKMHQVYELLGQIRLQILIIDKIHNIAGGSMARQHQFLQAIKRLGNELHISLVGVGTQEAFPAIHADPQLAHRFLPVSVSRWEMGRDYLKLLASFERMIPLHSASHLTRKTLAIRILAMSEGKIGEIAALLARAAVHSIRAGYERIDAQVLDEIEWIAPSDRKWL